MPETAGLHPYDGVDNDGFCATCGLGAGAALHLRATPTPLTERQLAQHFDQSLRPWIEDVVARELAHRMKILRQQLLAEITEASIRDTIRDAVAQHVTVTVAVI